MRENSTGFESVMARFSSDQKLELLHHIRMENQNDRMRMKQREQILYGNSTGQIPVKSMYMERGSLHGLGYDEVVRVGAKVVPEPGVQNENTIQKLRWSFRIRMMFAVLLFASYLLLDRGYIKTEVTGSRFIEVLNQDFVPESGELFFDFENSFPYTIFR